MAFTVSNIRRNVLGNLVSIDGSFTSAPGDSTLTVTHGLNSIVYARADIDEGGLNTPNSKITNSGGVATITWDDTMGYSGGFVFVGK